MSQLLPRSASNFHLNNLNADRHVRTQLVAPWDRVFRVKTDEERAEAMKQMLAAVDVLEGGLKE